MIILNFKALVSNFIFLESYGRPQYCLLMLYFCTSTFRDFTFIYFFQLIELSVCKLSSILNLNKLIFLFFIKYYFSSPLSQQFFQQFEVDDPNPQFLLKSISHILLVTYPTSSFLVSLFFS